MFNLSSYATDKFVRLTIRDCTGKYVWDFNLSYDLHNRKYDPVPQVHITPSLLPHRDLTEEIKVIR